MFEGNVAGSKLWVTVYRAAHGAFEVLAWEVRRAGARVDLGACVFAARWRNGGWRSRVGVLPDGDLRAVTRCVASLHRDG